MKIRKRMNDFFASSKRKIRVFPKIKIEKKKKKGREVKNLHAGLVPVVTEAYDDESFFLGEDGLVHRPS